MFVYSYVDIHLLMKQIWIMWTFIAMTFLGQLYIASHTPHLISYAGGLSEGWVGQI